MEKNIIKKVIYTTINVLYNIFKVGFSMEPYKKGSI